MNLFDQPLLTRELARQDLPLNPSSTYIHAASVEQRSLLDQKWRADQEAIGVVFVEVMDQARDGIAVSSPPINLIDALYSLRDSASLGELANKLTGTVYLDITGLTYNSWAPLLRACVSGGTELFVVYTEPGDYKRSAFPTHGMIYDLSESTEGLGPLPGFAAIRRAARAADACFVPLLGFEGARMGYAMEQVDPPRDKVVPIIGVPGFRPEYPFQTYAANRFSLESEFIHTNVRYAKANCPFELFFELCKIERDYPNDFLRIAPIGTKPHGLGAVLFALSRSDRVEIIYDHPKRRAQRTSGVSRACLYDAGTFVRSQFFLTGNA